MVKRQRFGFHDGLRSGIAAKERDPGIMYLKPQYLKTGPYGLYCLGNAAFLFSRVGNPPAR